MSSLKNKGGGGATMARYRWAAFGIAGFVGAACGVISTASAEDVAVGACNKWASTMEEPLPTRQESIDLTTELVAIAEEAAAMDSNYQPLATAFQGILDAGRAKNWTDLQVWTSVAFDECYEITDTEELLRQEIRERYGGGS